MDETEFLAVLIAEVVIDEVVIDGTIVNVMDVMEFDTQDVRMFA